MFFSALPPAIGGTGRLWFSDILSDFEGICPRTLSETLKGLQREGLVGRESFAETPPRVEYFLTGDGAELRRAILPLLRLASNRDSRERAHALSVRAGRHTGTVLQAPRRRTGKKKER